MAGTRLFTFRLVPVVAGMLARKGIGAAELVAEAGLPAEALHGEVTAPLARITRFIAVAADQLEDPHFGFTLADAAPTGVYGVAELVLRTAPDLERVAQLLCEVSSLINPLGQFSFIGGGLHYAIPGERETLGIHLNEFTIAYMARQLASFLDPPVQLERVWFSHTRTAGTDVVARRFQTSVEFGARDCGFAFPLETLARTPRTADPALYGFLYAQARAQLAHLGQRDIVSQVIRVMEVRLANGSVSAGAVAKAMAMAPRSLQRKLGEAGTSYREVLAYVRDSRRKQLRAIGATERTIADELGFADARSMRRALDEE